MVTYKRVLLKLSGEALADKNNNMILENYSLDQVAESIKLMVDKGLEVAVVVGAGNIWRGKLAKQIGLKDQLLIIWECLEQLLML